MHAAALRLLVPMLALGHVLGCTEARSDRCMLPPKITLQEQAAQAPRMHAEEAGSPRIPLEFSLPAFAKPVCAGGLCSISA